MKENSTKKRLNKVFLLTKIFCFEYKENKKKPIATIENLKANAANGSLLSMIGLVVMNADDHNNINMNGNILTI
jgi:hypothetical protein